MSDTGNPDDPVLLSVKDMREWLLGEINDSMKACELRVREATAFVTAYAMGELTAEEANKRFEAYEERWGEALFGVDSRGRGTDQAIVGSIDQARATYGSQEEMQKRYEDLIRCRTGHHWR